MERNSVSPRMSDGPQGTDHRKPLLERLAALLLRVPEDREQLLDLLRQAHERALLDAEAMAMIEGVLQVSELTARDIMVPRAEMDVVHIAQSPESFLPKVIESGHSRFPVVEGDRDNIVGILDAKSLLRLCARPAVAVHELLQPALFIPESKKLNVLLRDLRTQRAHLAIVVDEYGGTAGLVTLEDAIDHLVADLDDDFALDADDDIVRIEPAANGALRHRVRASARIDAFNEAMGTKLPTATETIGALLGEHLGRPPRRGERIQVDGVRFEVLRADATQALLLRTERLPGSANVAAATRAPAAPAVRAAAVPAAAAGVAAAGAAPPTLSSPTGAAPLAAAPAADTPAATAPALDAGRPAAETLAFDAHAAMSAPGAKMRRVKRAGTTVAHGS